MRASFLRLPRPDRLAALVVTTVVSTLVVGCSTGEEAPPYWEGGSSNGGPLGPGGLVGPLGGSRGDDESAETGGSATNNGTGGSGTGGTATSSGQLVLRLYDPLFGQGTKDLAISGTILVRNEADETWTSADYRGSPIAFSPPSDQPVWAAFVPPDVDDYFITLSQVSLSNPVLGVASISMIRDIFQSLAVPSEPNLGRAQLLVRVVDAQGQPLAQVEPEVPEAAEILFASVGTWVSSDQTSNEGMFLATNLPAPSFPGAVTPITLSGALEGSYLVPVVTSGVTVVTIAAD